MSFSSPSVTNTKSLAPYDMQGGTIMSRAAAEKRLDSLHPETEEYTQLWAALAKTVGIAEIYLPNQTYKVSVQKGHLLGGFGSSEHFFIGEQVKLGELEDRTVLNRNDCPVSFGHIIALAGDFYGIPNQPISLLGGSNEEKEKRFIAAFATIEEASETKPEEIRKLIREIEEEYNDVRYSAAPHHCYSSRLISSNNRFKEIKGNIDELLIDNSDHFSENAREAYLIGHALACREAAKAGQSKDKDLLKRAYALEAFACHFLTDLFAAGHLRNQRGPLESFLHTRLGFSPISSKRLSGALTFAQHEYDGEKGLEISTSKGDTWRAYGDGLFFTPKNKANEKKAIDTVQKSIDEVTAAYTTCTCHPTKMERHIPTAKESNHEPLYTTENGELFIFREGEKIPIQSKRAYLLEAIPLGLSVVPESYVNGFIDGYISPSSMEFPQALRNIQEVLSTIITPRVERLTGKVWHIVGVASFHQLKSIDEKNASLAHELMATAKATHEQGEVILGAVSQLASRVEKIHFRLETAPVEEDIKKIQASFLKLKTFQSLDPQQVNQIQSDLYDAVYRLTNTFLNVQENAKLFSDRSLLIAYAKIESNAPHEEKELTEKEKLTATRWFRQILRYQVAAFSTYLKLKYRTENRNNPISEIGDFKELFIHQIEKNRKSLIPEALFSSEAYVDSRQRKITMQNDFLEFAGKDDRDPQEEKGYHHKTLEPSFYQAFYASDLQAPRRTFFRDPQVQFSSTQPRGLPLNFEFEQLTSKYETLRKKVETRGVQLSELLAFQDQLIKASPLTQSQKGFQEMQSGVEVMTFAALELGGTDTSLQGDSSLIANPRYEYKGKHYYPRATSARNNGCAIHAVLGENIEGVYRYNGDPKRDYTNALAAAIETPLKERTSTQNHSLKAYSESIRNYLTGEDAGAQMLFGSFKGLELKQNWEAISNTEKETHSFDRQLQLSRLSEGKLWLPLIQGDNSPYLDLIMRDIEATQDPKSQWYKKTREETLKILQDNPNLIVNFVYQQKNPNPFLALLQSSSDLENAIGTERKSREKILKDLHAEQDLFIFSSEMVKNYVDTVNTYRFFLDTNDLKVLATLFGKKLVLIPEIPGSKFVDYEEINFELGEGEPIVIQHFGAHFSRCIKHEDLPPKREGLKPSSSTPLSMQTPSTESFLLDDPIAKLLSDQTDNFSKSSVAQGLFKKAEEGAFSEAQLKKLGAYLEKPKADDKTKSLVADILGAFCEKCGYLPKEAIQGLKFCVHDLNTDSYEKEDASV